MPTSSKSRGGTATKARGTKSRSSNGAKSRSSNGARSRSSSSRNSNGETDRYRQAAEDALQQLDWAIGYLHGIKKTGISKALAQNRSYIRRNLMGEADEPLPGQKTDET
jgi:hypothetical protein